MREKNLKNKISRWKIIAAFMLPRWLVYTASARMLNEVLEGDFTYKKLRHMRFTTAMNKWRESND